MSATVIPRWKATILMRPRSAGDVGREQRRTHEAGDAWRAIDDDVIGIARALGRFTVERIAGAAGSRVRAAATVESRTLRVGIDDDDALAASSPFAGEMESGCRLADAALLVEQRVNHGTAPGGGTPCTGVERGAAVRKIPKESWLEELRRAQSLESAPGVDVSGPR